MLLSYPRISSKGCSLLLLRAKSTLHFPESDGPGFNVKFNPLRIRQGNAKDALASRFTSYCSWSAGAEQR